MASCQHRHSSWSYNNRCNVLNCDNGNHEGARVGETLFLVLVLDFLKVSSRTTTYSCLARVCLVGCFNFAAPASSSGSPLPLHRILALEILKLPSSPRLL